MVVPALNPPRHRQRTPRAVRWQLCLYVVDQTPRSVLALANLRRFCRAHLAGRHRLEVVDVGIHPDRAVRDQIVAVPTLVRYLPRPVRVVIGALTDSAAMARGLGLSAAEVPSA